MEDLIEVGDQISRTGDNSNFITTYCPDAFWILKFYGKKQKIKYQLKDPCDLLM